MSKLESLARAAVAKIAALALAVFVVGASVPEIGRAHV